MYMYLMFLLPLGFFMLSTRMHERYLFPCLLFLAPLLPRRKHLWGFYAVLTVTYYLNLWYILRALNAEYFLAPYERWGSPSRSSTAACSWRRWRKGSG